MLNDLKADPAGWYQENDLRIKSTPDGLPLAPRRERLARILAG